MPDDASARQQERQPTTMLFDNVFKCLVEPHPEKLAQVGLLLQHSWTWQLEEEQMMLCGSAFRCLVSPQLENPWQVGLLLQHSESAHVALEHVQRAFVVVLQVRPFPSEPSTGS